MKKMSCFYSLLVILFLLTSAFAMQEGWNIPEEYKTMENPQAGVEDADEIGAELWADNCASCHGKIKVIDGKNVGKFEEELGDFSTEEFQKQSDGVLYYKSIIGNDDMPNFEEDITEVEERWLLINYIRTFAAE